MRDNDVKRTNRKDILYSQVKDIINKWLLFAQRRVFLVAPFLNWLQELS